MTGPDAERTAVGLARAFFGALQNRDVQRIGGLLGDDFVLEVPLHESGDNDPRHMRGWRGRAEALRNYERAFTELVKIRITDLVIVATTDPDVVFAEGFGDMLSRIGRPYKNRYAFRFDVREGRIRRLREYCNPVTSAISFDRPLPRTTDAGPRL